jgi:hypothetical protein
MAAGIIPAAAQAGPGAATPGSIIRATGVRAGAMKSISSSSSTGSLTLKPTNAYADLTSDNWSGYITPEAAGAYKETSATFTVPASISCTSTDTASSFWAGLDGSGDSTVEQDGVEADCDSGSPVLYAWVETFPSPEEEIVGTDGDAAPVEPGDSITSTVTEDSPSDYTFYVADTTQGWTFDTELAMPSGYTGEDLTSEVITEATTVNGTILPLTNFGKVGFADSLTVGSNQYYYASSNTTRIDLYQNNVEVDGVGALGTDGAFTVTYGTPAQPPATPAGLTASVDNISIGWAQVAGATQYEIQVFGPNSSTKLWHDSVINADQTHAIYYDVAQGTYTYRVRAISAQGDSSWSAEHSVTFTR